MDNQNDRAYSEGSEHTAPRGSNPGASQGTGASERDEHAPRGEQAPAPVPDVAPPSDIDEARGVIRRLHDELAVVKEQLRSMTEESDTAAGATASDERSEKGQLRSAAEELETSKEELQSVADELRALNDRLEVRIVETEAANRDLQHLMTATGIGTIYLDRRLCIKRYTRQVEDLCGIVETDVGRPLRHLTLRLGSDAVPGDAARVLREHTTIEREVQHTETRQWFLARFRPYHGVDGRIEGVVITFVDITEKKRYDEQLEALIEMLEELVFARAEQIKRLTSELILSEQSERERIAQVLHDDLQQLLLAFQMRMKALSRSLSEEQAARLAEAGTLIVHALDVSRTLTVELSPPVLKGEDVTVTLDWLALRMEHMHNLKVEVASSGPVRLPADVHLLVYHLLRELLFNVVKHAGTDRARVSVAREADRLVVLVEDEGAGFNPAAEQERRPATQGGFGLRSVRQRLSLLGGRLETDAAPDRGTRMTLFMPLDAAAAVDAAAAGPPGLRRSVYIVDDDAHVREALVMLIADEPDLEVCGVATAAAEALAAIPGAAPDLVLTDLSLPGMSGLELVERLLKQNALQRVAVLSGHPEPRYAEEARAAGARGYVLKGDADAMLQGIRRALSDGA